MESPNAYRLHEVREQYGSCPHCKELLAEITDSWDTDIDVYCGKCGRPITGLALWAMVQKLRRLLPITALRELGL